MLTRNRWRGSGPFGSSTTPTSTTTAASYPSDTALEALFYYGKYLLAKLPPRGEGGTVDLSSAVVLTHLRTDLLAKEEMLSLTEGPDEPLPGHTGEGRGRQAETPYEHLSALIAALNERFGSSLGQADLIWFEQQEEHLRADDDVRAVALHNDREQFSVWLQPVIEAAIVERHQQNGELFDAYFGKDDYRVLVDDFLSRRLYDRLRADA